MKHLLNQTSIFYTEKSPESDEYGRFDWSNPVEVKCRVARTSRSIRFADGTEKTISLIMQILADQPAIIGQKVQYLNGNYEVVKFDEWVNINNTQGYYVELSDYQTENTFTDA